MLKSILLVLIFFVPLSAQQLKLVPHKITLKDGKTFSLNLPADYEIIPAAEGLKRVRFSEHALIRFWTPTQPFSSKTKPTFSGLCRKIRLKNLLTRVLRFSFIFNRS